MNLHSFPALVLLSAAGCVATSSQVERLEAKVDRLLAHTQRETLAQIFGEQAEAIQDRIEVLDQEERRRMDTLVSEYQSGSKSVEEVRGHLVNVLGGTTRVVSTGRGIWVRDEGGDKLRAVARETKIADCRRLTESELPESIADNRRLARFTWGAGEVDGRTVLFPWELTMSSFAREIAENTARRTAEELMRMSEGRGWSRPVHIKVTTEDPSDVKISTPWAEDVYVEEE